MSNSIQETSINFFPGGHDHDGNGSSLIETTAYSIYDWNVGYTGTGSRLVRQQDNFESLKVVVTQMVTDIILTPSGVRLSPNNVRAVHIEANSITADKIAANAITASELTANLILTNNVIRSNNFNGTIASNNVITAQGNAGWAITSAGDAVFSNTAIRGGLTAEAVYIGVDDYWYSNGAFKLGGSTGISKTSGGDVTIGTNVTINGNISATNIDSGTLTSSPGGNDVDLNFGNGAFTVDSDGNLFANSGEFEGTVTATAGEIGGWNIDSDELNALSGEVLMNSSTGDAQFNGMVVQEDLRVEGDIDNRIASALYYNYNNAQAYNALLAYWSGTSGDIRLGYDSGSSQRFKDILGEATGDYDPENLLNIPIILFRYKPGHLGEDQPDQDKIWCGMIAENVAEHYPSLVQYDGDGLVRGYSHTGMIPPLLGLVQKLNAKIEALEARIQELENRV